MLPKGSTPRQGQVAKRRRGREQGFDCNVVSPYREIGYGEQQAADRGLASALLSRRAIQPATPPQAFVPSGLGRLADKPFSRRRISLRILKVPMHARDLVELAALVAVHSSALEQGTGGVPASAQEEY